jgi:hypothetical protein
MAEQIELVCQYCHIKFIRIKKWAKRFERHFCSRQCGLNYYRYKIRKFKPPVEVSCTVCHKKFNKEHCQIRKTGNNFCSRSCSAKYNGHKYPKRKKKHLPKLCLNCGYKYTKRNKSKCCSKKCQIEWDYKAQIEKWKRGEHRGWEGKSCKISPFIRKYLFIKYENKCGKCGWGEINKFTNKIPLTVNHLDGNAENCKEENLELICPNCHSLTHNYGSRNKNSKRKYRYYRLQE